MCVLTIAAIRFVRGVCCREANAAAERTACCPGARGVVFMFRVWRVARVAAEHRNVSRRRDIVGYVSELFVVTVVAIRFVRGVCRRDANGVLSWGP